jgi:cycloeucalenol cycloisomerase
MTTRTLAGVALPVARHARWFSANPAKAWGERFYLVYTPLWITLVAIVQHTEAFRTWGDVGHLAYSLAIFLPLWLVPLVAPAAADRGRPLADRYILKINVWLWVFAFVQSYFGTHYFYKVLGMRYGFPVSWELNGVPFMLYLQAFVYFTTYQVLINLVMRRWLTSSARPNPLVTVALLAALSFAMAFGETWFMAQDFMQDYFRYEDRAAMLRYGSIFYGGLFFIMFPFVFRIDERADAPTPMRQVVIEALGANMLMLLWYDLWRLALGPIVGDGAGSGGLPFL